MVGIRMIALVGLVAVSCSNSTVEGDPNDLSVEGEAVDMAVAQQGNSDLAGIFCDDKYCYGNKCCGSFDRSKDLGMSYCATGASCDFPDAGEDVRQRSLECDGPEECTTGQNCCVALANITGKTQYSDIVCGAAPRTLPANMNEPANPKCTPYIVGTSHGDTRLCHTNTDCTPGVDSIPQGAMALNNCCSGSLFGIKASFCFTNNPLILGALAGQGYLITCQ